MALTPLQTFSGLDFGPGHLFQTSDLDEARILCGRVLNPHDLRVTGQAQPFRSRMHHLRLGGLSLNRLTWGAPVAVDPDRLGSYYLLSMPVKGRARFKLDGQETEVSPGCVGVVNAVQRFSFEASAGFEQVALRIERRAVDAGWEALTGVAPSRAINFQCGLATSGSAWRAVEPVMRLLAQALAQGRPGPQVAHLQARLEELVVTTLLLNQPHSQSDQLFQADVKLRPAVVRRAEAYMDERLAEPVTVSEVARASGVAVRTLQTAFRAAHGCGPMAWLKVQRLQAVRDSLRACVGARSSVTDTALQFGFTHLGEFSKAYRLQFGETARETLRRA
jgi:AraC-like DNA-binding protein